MKSPVRQTTLAEQLIIPIGFMGLFLLIAGLVGIHFFNEQHTRRDLLRQAEIVALAATSATENIELRGELQRLITTLASEPNVRTILVMGKEPPRVLASSRHDWLDQHPDYLPRRTFREAWRESLRENGVQTRFSRGERNFIYILPITYIVPGGEQLLPERGAVLVELDGRLQQSAHQQQLVLLSLAAAMGLMGLLLLSGGLIYNKVLAPLGNLRSQLTVDPDDDAVLRTPRKVAHEIGLLVEAINQARDQRREKARLARESSQLLELALRSNRQGFLDWDMVNDQLTINREYAEVLGEFADTYRPTLDELIERIHPEDRGQIHTALADYLEGRNSEYRVEHRVRIADGSYRWMLAIGQIAERDPTGKPVRIIGTHTDIHETKARAAELIRSETRLRTIFEGSPVGITALDPKNRRIVLCNPAMAAMFGTSVDTFLQRPVEDLHPTQARDLVRFHLGQMELGKLDPVILPCQRDDGSVFYASITPRPLELDGKATLLAFFNDVTAEHEAKRSLASSQNDLLNAQRIARLGSWRFNLDTEEFTFSKNFPLLIKVDREAINVKMLVERIPPADLPLLTNAWHRAKRGEMVEIEHRLMLEDTEWWFDTHAEPVRDSEGKVIAINGVCRDINPRKTTELALQRSQRMESIGTLAGGIAHDLNNLLTPIVISIDLLKQQAPGAANTCSLLEKSAQKASGIVRQLLTFARGAGAQRGPVQIRHEMAEIERFIRSTFDRSIEIAVECPRDLPALLADPTQIHQILLNLCVNARDAMPEGGHLNLKVSHHPPREVPSGKGFGNSRKELDYLCIRVSDTGTGMPEDVLERIFDPFFTTKPVDKGTGLGLSTVLGIVKAHDGFICVDSKPDQGTTFQVWLPIIESNRTAPASPSKAIPRGKGDLVLIADDESSIRDMLGIFLETWGFEVQIAVDGEDAAHQLDVLGEKCKLLITDINMPKMDGLALIRKAREDYPDLPAIVITGVADEIRLHQLSALKVPHLLQKPFTIRELTEILKNWPNLPAVKPTTPAPE